jgi:hypothetical protein
MKIVPWPFENYPVNQIVPQRTTKKKFTVGVQHSKTEDTIWLLVNGPELNQEEKLLKL